MDYRDMVESHKRNHEAKEELVDLTPAKGYYDGCKKFDWELDELCQQMERNSTVRTMTAEESARWMQQPGRRPAIAAFVDITKTMAQGSPGSIVSLYQ